MTAQKRVESSFIAQLQRRRAHTLLFLEASIITKSPTWAWCRSILFLALAFLVRAAYHLAALPAAEWDLPFENPRSVLSAHLAACTVFALGIMAQYAMFATLNSRPALAFWHRRIGSAVLFASALASSSALLLSLRALHGSGAIFGPWSGGWLFATSAAWVAARNRRYAAHRNWAQLLIINALLFPVGRTLLAACIFFEVPEADAYFGSIVLSAILLGTRMVSVARLHSEVEQRRATHARARATFHRTLVAPAARRRLLRNAEEGPGLRRRGTRLRASRAARSRTPGRRSQRL